MTPSQELDFVPLLLAAAIVASSSYQHCSATASTTGYLWRGSRNRAAHPLRGLIVESSARGPG